MSERTSLEEMFDISSDSDRDIDDETISTYESGEREDVSRAEPIVEEEPKVHIPTVISKIKGSVDIPEEFKFAESNTFYSMLRNIYRGKSVLVTGPSG